MKKIILILALCAPLLPCLSQSDGYGTAEYRIETFGSAATDDRTPFWIAGNRYGTVPLDAGNGYLRAGVFHLRQPAAAGKGLRWGAGLDVVAGTSRYRNVYVQQIYAEAGYKCLHLTVGSKENYTSLWDKNLSSGDLVHSSNARPVPEINVSVPRFTTVPYTGGILQFRGDFALGRSFDTGYLNAFHSGSTWIKGVLWHHKSLHARLLDPHGRFPLTAAAGLRHHAQWGGTSTDPGEGVQPHSFKDLIRIVLGRSGGEDASLSAQKNVLGNHYGSYDIKIGYLNPLFDLHVYRQHYFDDASGMELFNLPDGLYGIQVDMAHFTPVSKVVIEYVYTKNQSGPVHYITYDHLEYPGFGGGRDDYYNNEEYTTGISYFDRGIGSPLITSPEYNRNGKTGFQNNRIRAWHIGVEGYFSGQVAWRLLMTRPEGWGIPNKPFLKKTADLSCAAKISCCHPRLEGWLFSGEVAADRGPLYGDHLGFALSISKTGILKRW